MRRHVSEMIVDYLQRNRDAADTLEGIEQWWIDRGRIEPRTEEVAEALAHLSEAGLIATCKLGDGNTLYKRGPRMNACGEPPVRPE